MKLLANLTLSELALLDNQLRSAQLHTAWIYTGSQYVSAALTPEPGRGLLDDLAAARRAVNDAFFGPVTS